MEITLSLIQAGLIALGELALILTYIHVKDSRKQDKIDERFLRLEKDQSELSKECTRREEHHAALTRIDLQLSEIRSIVISQSKEKS